MITRIVHRGQEGEHLCVLGAVDNENGRIIAQQMLQWLVPLYDIYIIWHDGSEYEYPAMSYAQRLSIEAQRPVLYIHTKGAFNRPELSADIRDMWQHEFTINQGLYFGLVNRPYAVVACPTTGSDKTTWHNAFVANHQAWSEIPTIQQSNNRMKYERLFIGQTPQVIGVLRNDMHRTEGHVDSKTMRVWNQIKQSL